MIPGFGGSPEEGKDYPLRYSGLENSRDCKELDMTEQLSLFLASRIAQLVKNPPAMQEIPVQFLDWEDPLEKG